MIEFNKRNMRSWSIMGINPSVWSIGFGEVAESKENLTVLAADSQRISGLTRMESKHPELFYNVGIAEQNMIGIAAGMAMEGSSVYLTTYAPFVTFRCADQVRHLMGNMNLDIKAIGSSAGLTMGWSGTALQAINDIAFMRSIPNMTVLSPADCTEAVKMMLAMPQLTGPVYLRLCGTTAIPMVYEEDYAFEIGKAVTLRSGEEIALLATGTDLVHSAVKAADRIKEECGLGITVVNMHTIKPIDKSCIERLAASHRTLFTIEEHNILGGLGSAVAEVTAQMDHPAKQVFLGIQDTNYKMGSRPFMLEQAGLTEQKIYDAIMQYINKRRV